MAGSLAIRGRSAAGAAGPSAAGVAAVACGYVAVNTSSAVTMAVGAFVVASIAIALVVSATAGWAWPLHPITLVFGPPAVAGIGYAAAGGAAVIETYVALVCAELIGLSFGALAASQAPIARPNAVDGSSLVRFSRSLMILAVVGIVLTIIQVGAPALTPNVESVRALANFTGAGYGRILAYLVVPAVLLQHATPTPRRRRLSLLFAVGVVLLLADRSPFVYLAVPLGFIALRDVPKRLQRVLVSRSSCRTSPDSCCRRNGARSSYARL